MINITESLRLGWEIMIGLHSCKILPGYCGPQSKLLGRFLTRRKQNSEFLAEVFLDSTRLKNLLIEIERRLLR